MPFTRPSITDLVTQQSTDLGAGLAGVDPLLRRSLAKVLARVNAGGLHGLYGELDYLARQLFPDTAEKDHLDRWASIWNVPREQPTAASGPVVFTGTATLIVPAGQVMTRSDGATFTVAADATLTGSPATAAATVTATTPGSAGNTDAGSILTMQSPISGIASSATVGADGLGGGADQELDDSLRARLLDRIQQPPQGGASNDYVTWAKSVPGVTRVWVLPNWLGAGSVGVTFAMDGRADIIPLAADVANVQAAIDAPFCRPVTARVVVFAPTPAPLNPQIHLNPDSTAGRTAVTAELADLVARESTGAGGTLYLSQIREAIGAAAGVTDYTLENITADVVTPAGQLVVPGTPSWV